MTLQSARMLPRLLTTNVWSDLQRFPAVALLGPRQCGKTTLASTLTERHARDGRPVLRLDLERPSDLAKLTDAETFLSRHAGALVCLDEVQRAPELFPVLRALIDDDRRPGRFLLLGSASPALLRQSSESLAGRLAVHELSPLSWSEVVPGGHASQDERWSRGGFPGSLLASTNDDSVRWREEFVRTFLERDLPQLGSRTPSTTLGRFWRMTAHLHGQLLNLSALGRSIGASHTAVRHYLDLLEAAFVLRTLPPYEANLGKRLVKSPKVYVRDTGLLHSLLDLRTHDDLAGHPVFGASWEGFVLEQVLVEHPGWRASFYRSASGDELDLVLTRGRRRVAIECKASARPDVGKGFWNARRDLGLDEAYVVAPVRMPFPLKDGVEVVGLGDLLSRLGEGASTPNS